MLVPQTSVNLGKKWPDHPISCQCTQSIFSLNNVWHTFDLEPGRYGRFFNSFSQCRSVLRPQRLLVQTPTVAVFGIWILAKLVSHANLSRKNCTLLMLPFSTIDLLQLENHGSFPIHQPFRPTVARFADQFHE
ncbi:unnamed protein product [Schistosoma turkestanicum]|nr:unnamed protein product [Schistosoma turkestanicum]